MSADEKRFVVKVISAAIVIIILYLMTRVTLAKMSEPTPIPYLKLPPWQTVQPTYTYTEIPGPARNI